MSLEWEYSYLRRRLDFEMLRVLGWGEVIRLTQQGPLPFDLESDRNVLRDALAILTQHCDLFRDWLRLRQSEPDPLQSRFATEIAPERDLQIPSTSRMLLEPLFSSVYTTSSHKTSPMDVHSGTLSSTEVIEGLNKLETYNDKLQNLLRPSTIEILEEKLSETSLGLLQLTSTLEDTKGLLKVIERLQGDDLPQSVTKQTLAHFARFKAHYMEIEQQTEDDMVTATVYRLDDEVLRKKDLELYMEDFLFFQYELDGEPLDGESAVSAVYLSLIHI